ncbi:MAG: hypothetical protein KAJ55_11675, partial [Anaerolineales bacterium]|nr:hypothetical protein [Anaerolineales bacterium]
ALSRQLQQTAGLYGLGTAETEVLTQLVSTGTVNRSQSILEQLAMLTSGLREYDLTMSDREVEHALIAAIFQTNPRVRYGAVIYNPRKPTKVIAHLR